MMTGKLRYTTESGSIYIIDYDNKKWQRWAGEDAATIRTSDGEEESFIHCYIDLLNCIVLVLSPMSEEYWARVITSTPIIDKERLV